MKNQNNVEIVREANKPLELEVGHIARIDNGYFMCCSVGHTEHNVIYNLINLENGYRFTEPKPLPDLREWFNMYRQLYGAEILGFADITVTI